MTSEEMGLISAQRLDGGLNHPQIVFQDFSCGPRPPAPQHQQQRREPNPKTTRSELPTFLGGNLHFYPPHHPSEFRAKILTGYEITGVDAAPDQQGHLHHQDGGHRNWNGNGQPSATPSGDGSDDEELDDEDDEDDNGDNDVELVRVNDSNSNNNNNNNNNNSSNNSGNSIAADKIGNLNASHLPVFGSNNDGNVVQSGNDSNNPRANAGENHHQRGQMSQYQNVATVGDPNGDLYYPQYLQGPEGSVSGQKDVVVDNGCGFSGRKDTLYSSEAGESLRAILSDPLSGALMDDAMILPCGHSFGGGGIQHVIQMKACYSCSQAVSEDSVSPNLSLRAAVLAFRREEELHINRASKRRRDRFEQGKGGYNDSMAMDHPRGRGVQFPFVVSDRVIIKGNKRTPQRFVGREAVVTTQCLNGWYVVKTLDNAESVKLQYRSLAKVSDNPSSTRSMSSKITPNRL